jgi:spore coat polysaccharide biosynthesis protein SpsF (cytidylyltransferase family)
MKVVAIVQARMGSARLPGKVLKILGNASMLERVISRVRRSKRVSQVLVATTVKPADEPIVRACRRMGIEVFRGSESDVLDRYYRAAQQVRAHAVVRITADCPFVDPALVDELLFLFSRQRPDYASTCLARSYPRGLDAEVMTCAALSAAWREARESYQREHVTPFLYENPSRFRLLSLEAAGNFSELRWTVDTAEDLSFARAVYRHFRNADDFGWREILDLVNARPELTQINKHVLQKTMEEG